MKRRFKFGLVAKCVNEGSVVEQNLGALDVVVLGGDVQRCGALMILVDVITHFVEAKN